MIVSDFYLFERDDVIVSVSVAVFVKFPVGGLVERRVTRSCRVWQVLNDELG